MCGRFTVTLPQKEWIKWHPPIRFIGEYKPRYNVAPGQYVATISDSKTWEVRYYRWGLIPSWTNRTEPGTGHINARIESLREKPSFRDSFQHRRCVILADGFYEWQIGTIKKTNKIPYHIRVRENRPFVFAGLWDTWQPSDGNVLFSCTIVTTQANEQLRSIHHRMPVLLDRQGMEEWLTPGILSQEQQAKFLQPIPSEEIGIRSVSPKVNNFRNDSAECLETAPEQLRF